MDYLTNASYNDGMPNPVQSWTYDAAGNRNDSVCDNLNRATAIGGVACTNDILGNRLSKGSTSYSWDDLNRMAGLSNSSFQTSYVYRADGMRASKTGFDGEETRFTRYRYDGQMGIEDFETRDNNQVNGVRSVLMQYGLGARGIDYMKTTTVTGSGVNQQTQTVDSYPIYDAHGNMVAALSRSGTNDYALSNQRSFDAWGNVRIGSTSGNPTGRYCANIGHRQDDESGLVYMRARYYEPTSGRFVSEDPSLAGRNWYIYANCNPTSFVDSTGNDATPRNGHEGIFNFWIQMGLFTGGLAAVMFIWPLKKVGRLGVAAMFFVAVQAFDNALDNTDFNKPGWMSLSEIPPWLIAAAEGCAAFAKSSHAQGWLLYSLVIVTTIYLAEVCGALWGVIESE